MAREFLPRAHYLGPPARLESPLPDLMLEAVSIAPDGNALSIWRMSHSVMVASHAPETTELLTIDKFPWNIRFVQPLPGNRHLVVEGWHRGANAWVVDLNGDILQAANVGHAVGQAVTSRSGDVWIGYTDQGVFDGDRLSRHGLVRFNDSLQPVWTYEAVSNRDGIDDCEGVNVHDDTVWMCPYTQFPLLRVRDDQVRSWGNPEFRTNIGAVLVDEATNTVGLVSTGWSAYPGTCVVGHLTDSSFAPDCALVLRLPDGAALPRDAELTGKGSRLHVVHGRSWYTVDLRDLPQGDSGERRPGRTT